jgi:hypothetical protein
MGYGYTRSSPVNFIAHAVVALALGGRSPLDHPGQFINRVKRVIRRSTIGFAEKIR